jgi:hypothetical protein
MPKPPIPSFVGAYDVPKNGYSVLPIVIIIVIIAISIYLYRDLSNSKYSNES